MQDAALSSFDEELSLAIEIVPVEEEDDDLDTLAAVGQVHAGIQQDVSRLEGYTTSSLPTNERGFDIIMLIVLAGTSIAASKDLLTSIFNVITAAIELLTKRGHVQEIEIIADGKTLILRDLNKKTAKELIEAFEHQHPGTSASFTAKTDLQVKAKVSKKSRMKNGRRQQ